jgi:hypothetical protein
MIMAIFSSRNGYATLDLFYRRRFEKVCEPVSYMRSRLSQWTVRGSLV